MATTIKWTREEAAQLSGWLRPNLRLDDLPNNSYNATDPDTGSKIRCAVTGCETRGNALALIWEETDGKRQLVPAMWQLEVVAWMGHNSTKRQIPLCRQHARIIEISFAPPRKPPPGASLTPVREIMAEKLAVSKNDRFAKIQAVMGESPTLPAPLPLRFELLAPYLILGLLELLALLNLPEDERAYYEAYARYDELI
jgi:hypothetical protein